MVGLLWVLAGACSSVDSPAEPTGLDQALGGELDAVVAEVQAEPTAEGAILAIRRFARAHPEQMRDLCPRLKTGPLREECTRWQGRQHLWEKQDLTTWARPRPDGADAGSAPVPSTEGILDFASTAPTPGLCADAVDVASCADSAAQAAVARGDASGAAGACSVHPEPKWRSECFFRTAEATLVRGWEDGYRPAVALCYAAGDFRDRCLSHLTMRLASLHVGDSTLDPRGLLADSEFWARAVSMAGAIDRTWTAREPAHADAMVSAFWSYIVARATFAVESMHGGLLDVLPPELHPHVRAAVAWRVVRHSEQPAAGLAGWVERVARVLERRGPAEGFRSVVPDADKFAGAVNLWRRKQPAPAGAQVTAYLGRSRRVWTTDLDAELAICVLEALAREPWTPDAETVKRVIDEGLVHPHPLVRWTACRLNAHGAGNRADRSDLLGPPSRICDAARVDPASASEMPTSF